MSYVIKKLAIQNSFPNKLSTAERELIQRIRISAARLNIEGVEVQSGAQADESRADLLLLMHEVTPKLADITTIGALWNPPSQIHHDPVRIDYLRSYDGYLSASAVIDEFIKEKVSINLENKKPTAPFRFYPSTPKNIATAEEFNSLAYVGVHWDGERHNELLANLHSTGHINFYGPTSAWNHLERSYKGSVPFDGSSLVRKLSEHGIVLCLHRDEHINADTPSMRLFEAASAGCIIFSDNIPFAQRTFGDSVFIIPTDANRADFIREKLAWIKSHKGQAREMAMEAKKIFETNLALDNLLEKAIHFGEVISDERRAATFLDRTVLRFKKIDVFCTVFHEDLNEVTHLIRNLEQQVHVRVRLVLFTDVLNISEYIEKNTINLKISILFIYSEKKNLWQSYLEYCRSLPKTSLVANFTINTTWASMHLFSLWKALREKHFDCFSYASAVFIIDNPSSIQAPNYDGDALEKIEDNRFLYRQKFDDELLVGFSNRKAVINNRLNFLSTAGYFVKTSEAEDDSELRDPSLNQSQFGNFICSGLVTCFHYRMQPDSIDKPRFS